MGAQSALLWWVLEGSNLDLINGRESARKCPFCAQDVNLRTARRRAWTNF